MLQLPVTVLKVCLRGKGNKMNTEDSRHALFGIISGESRML